MLTSSRAYKVDFFLLSCQEVDEILNQLKFDDQNHAIAHRGIEEAFPYAKIAATKGIFQNDSRPSPPYALISVKAAATGDDRIYAITRLGETINLNNRSRGLYKQSIINELSLPVNEPTSEEDVGDVILVSFGTRTSQDNYQAICEAILLRSCEYKCDCILCVVHVHCVVDKDW